MSGMQLQFLGGVGTVTGSKFLVRTARASVLVDCGLFQGLRELRRRNWDPFPGRPAGLDAVVVTHAHLDHCGYLPRLVREGFAGPIWTTPGTAELAEIVLRDSAHLMEEEARNARAGGWSKHEQPEPLYTAGDVAQVITMLRPIELDAPTDVAAGLRLTFRAAGHILGAAGALLEADGGHRLFVSGDVGRPQHPVLVPPAPFPETEVALVESTYGDRLHEPDSGRTRLAEFITRVAGRGGSVLIPAFAVDRTETLLMDLGRMRRAGEIPELPVYVDSPMALAALDVYRRAIKDGSSQVRAPNGPGDPFDPGRLLEARTVEESRALNDPQWPSVIISASGMATGGRVLHHLRHLLPEPKHGVAIVGFAAEGTRARMLVDGAPALKMHGRYVPVRAEVLDVASYSAHADADELLAWLGTAPRPPQVTYLVHGEPRATAALDERITRELGWFVVVPRQGEVVRGW